MGQVLRYHPGIAVFCSIPRSGVRTGPGPTPGPSGTWGTALGLVLVSAGFAVQIRAWSFLCDDAFISFRYARNLAELGELVFNPGERVEAYTNFLWVLVLALGARLGLALETLAQALGVASSALTLVLCSRLLGRLRSPDSACRGFGPWDLLPAALLVGMPEFVVWSQGGLETAFAGLFILAALTAWLAGRWTLAAGCAALAGLTRPDALLMPLVFVPTTLVFLPRAIARPRASAPGRAAAFLGPLLTLLVPLLAQVCWRRIYYGTWLPNTWAVKSHGTLLRSSYGGPYLGAWAWGLGLPCALVLAPLLRARHLSLLIPAAAVAGYAFCLGGDFMAYGRFLYPATLLWGCLAAWLSLDAVDFVLKQRPGRLSRCGLSGLGVLLALGIGVRSWTRWDLDRRKAQGWLDGRWEGVHAMDRFARGRHAVGVWMRQHLPPDTRVVVGAAGALPYASGLRVLDLFGLTDPRIARLPEVVPRSGPKARPGHQIVAPDPYVRSWDPDLWCRYDGPQKPPQALAHQLFGLDYTWACIQPGPILDPRAPDGSFHLGYYCCGRRKDRTVGPFGPESDA